MRADRAVEPTKSENITVTWRRSARSSGGALGAVAGRRQQGALPPVSVRRAAIASSSLRRCPTAETPRSFRSSAVRLGRTVSSISFSRNAASYFPRPRLRSQTTMSMTGPRFLLAAYHPARGTERVYSGVGVGKSSEKGSRPRSRKAVGAEVSLQLLINAAVR